jgi:hypothetical protein
MVPYKTIICRRWKNEGHCNHPNCLYAHGKNEIRRNDGIGHLTNYGQKAYFWTFGTFSHEGKSRNDTELVSAACRDRLVFFWTFFCP